MPRTNDYYTIDDWISDHCPVCGTYDQWDPACCEEDDD